MWKLLFGVLLFAGPHLFSTGLPGLRDNLRNSMREKTYKMAYSALSLLGLVFLALGYLAGRSGFEQMGLVWRTAFCFSADSRGVHPDIQQWQPQSSSQLGEASIFIGSCALVHGAFADEW
jgi:NnrU protein